MKSGDSYVNSLLCRIDELEAQVSELQSQLLIKKERQLRIIRDLSDALVVAGDL